MRILSAYVAIGLLCFTTVYGPLLHEHPAGELDGRSAIIHAHFPEPEEAPLPKGHSIGFRHSHAKAVWLDGFTTTTPDSLQRIAVVATILIAPDRQYPRYEIPWVDMPRAHSPPSLASSIPRSPPV